MGLQAKIWSFCGVLLCEVAGSVPLPASSGTNGRSLPVVGPCPRGSDYRDGCFEAGSGSAGFTNLLEGYPAPPPWNVAGVHYSVGIPRNIVLKDPTAADLPLGCSLTGTAVTCSGPVTLEGYDFSLHGGTTLSISSGNVMVRDCLFVVGPNQGASGRIVDVSGETSARFLHNEFDGANIAVTPQRGQTINATNAGEIIFKYNYFHNSGGDMIDFGGGPQVNVVQYNLFKDIGLNTAHSDTLQWCGSVVHDSDISFNAMVQTVSGLSGMGLVVPNSECPGARMSNLLVHNNTLISKTRDNFALGTDVMQDAGPAVADHVAVFDNYVDPTGIMSFTGSPWFPTGFYGATLPRPSALHSLIDMRSGSPVPLPTKSKPASISPYYYVYPDAAGYTPGLSDLYSISASPASGVVPAGQTITFVLDMDEPWEVRGKPKLSLSSGGAAEYSGGAGSTKLTFTYRVKAGERANDLAITAVDLDGGTIKDAVGNSANMLGAVATFHGLDVRTSRRSQGH